MAETIDLKIYGIPDNFPIVIDTEGPDWDLRAKLQAPFQAHDVEWRLDRVGEKRGGGLYAKCLAYINNRAIMNRLDDVFGPTGWSSDITAIADKGFLCSITAGGVRKTDGSDVTRFEAFKGGISGSMKRAGYQWGIGRYLYYLEEGFAVIAQGKSLVTPTYANVNVAKKGQPANWKTFHWGPPPMPDWALPPEGFSRVPGSALLAPTATSIVETQDSTDTVPQVDTDGHATKKQMYYIHGLAKKKVTNNMTKDGGENLSMYEKYVQWVNEARERKDAKAPEAKPWINPVLTDAEADRLIEVLEALPDQKD